MIKQPKYSAKDIAASLAIHKVAPGGVCRVQLVWSESRGKWDKHPVAHWPPKTLPMPAHAHWPKLPSPMLQQWFADEPSLKGIGISCHKFGMLGIDLDEGNPTELIDIIKKRCGADPLGSASTQRGHRIYYQVRDEDRKNPIVGWKIDGFNGCGEILLYTQYDYIWDPISTKNAIMANLGGMYNGPPIDMNIFQSTKVESSPIQYQNKSSTDEIDARMIAEAYCLTPHPEKEHTWRGPCPKCGEGETRFEVSQGHSRPTVVCWVCGLRGTKDVMNEIYTRVKSTHTHFASMSSAVDHFLDTVKPRVEPKKIDEKHNQTCDDDITIRTWINDEGKEEKGAFFEDEQVATQTTENNKDVWILTMPSGQHVWSSVIALKLTGTKVRKLRFGQEPQYSKDNERTWHTISDGSEADLWIEVERNVFTATKTSIKSVSPNKEVKKTAMNSLLENEHDPVRDWLENLPPWDGRPRLDTHMDDMGMTIHAKCTIPSGKQIDFTNIAQAYIPLEVVRLTYFPGEQRNPMPVFRGIGNEGKSSYGARILPPSLQHLTTADYRLTMTGQVAGQLLAKSKVVELREFGVDKFSDLNVVKGSAMTGDIDYRAPWGTRPIKLRRHDVTYVTTNQGNLPEGDPALHRRFFYCRVIGHAHLVDNKAWTALDDTIPDTRYTLRDQIFAEAKHRVFNASNPKSYTEVPELKPQEFMEYNVSMGGSYHTPVETFQKNVDNAVEFLIQDGRHELSMRDMKAAITCVDHARPIMSAEQVEELSESMSGSGDMSKAGAKEVLKAMSNLRNDSVQQSIQRNAEDRAREGGDSALRYWWKRGVNKGKGHKRAGFQFRMIGNIDSNMVQYQDILDAVEKLKHQDIRVNCHNVANAMHLDPASVEESEAWERYLTYMED